MTWTDILVFAEGSDSGLARAHMAADMAVRHGAALEICIPAVIPTPFGSGGGSIAANVIDQEYQGAHEDATRALVLVRNSFPLLGRNLKVEAPEVHQIDLPRLAAALARRTDIVIAGQPIATDFSRTDDSVLEGALMRSGRPCLMLPRWNAPRIFGQRALIAWKGTRQAARAVHDAMPLLARADSVGIVTIGQGAELDGEGPLGLSRLAGHLIRHGVRAEAPWSHPGPSVGAGILAEAHRWNADLLVIGAYGHSPFRERALGGATRSLVRDSDIPILMSH